MIITEELITKVYDYINTNSELNKNLEYLSHYQFTGVDNLKDKTIFNVMHDKSGFVGFCTNEVFSRGINLDVAPELEYTIVPVLANYLISYLTSFAAMDLFLAKYRDHYFKTINSPLIKIISTKYVTIGLDGRILVELMEDEPNGGMAAFDMNIIFSGTMDYKSIKNLLDFIIKIRIMQDAGRYTMNELKVKDISALALEDLFEQAGW